MIGHSAKSVMMVSPFFRPNIGGVETHLDDLCEYLRSHDHMVYVVTYKPLTTLIDAPRTEKCENMEVYRISWLGRNLFHKLEPYPCFEFAYLFPGLFVGSLMTLLKHPEVDAIHAHGLISTMTAKILSKVFRKKSVSSTHAFYDLGNRPILKRLTRWLFSSFDVVLVLSDQSRKEIIESGVQKSLVKVYTYWVDQGLFRPMDKIEAKIKCGWEGEFVVLFVGRLLEKKGVREIIRAAKEIDKDVLFAFVGTGPLQNEVNMSSEECDNILYVGPVDNKELPQYYNAADLVIVPSQYEEGFGRVIVEALSCGTPVVASNKGGIPDVLSVDVGILIDPIVENIVMEVEYLRAHPDLLNAMAARCRRYAEERFSCSNARIFEEAYGAN